MGSREGPDAFPLSLKIAQKPYIIESLGPKAIKYESLEGKGLGLRVSASGSRVWLPVLESMLWRVSSSENSRTGHPSFDEGFGV